MRKILLAAFFLSSINAFSQSDGLISHYMFNPLIINPAYAGFDEALTVNAMVKSQWTGVEGAPNTQIFSLHSPVTEKMSVGLILANDQMGPLNQKGFFATYAYRVPFSDGYVSLGLQAGSTFYNMQTENFSLLNPMDPVFSGNNFNQAVPNFGSGILYARKNFYLGLSMPQLLRFSEEEFISHSLQRQNTILYGSYSFTLNNDLQVNPTTLLYFRNGLPPEINVGANFLIRKVIWAGVLYRSQQTLSFLSKLMLNRQLTIGYAYDYHLGEVRSLANGSHEFLFSYTFNYKKRLVSPQYF